MSDIIHVEDKYYILATSPFADDRTRVLKHGDTFALCDQHGDILPVGLGEQGIYHEGTRFLSKLVLRVGPARGSLMRPLLLSSTVIESNDLLAVDLTNPDMLVDGAGKDGASVSVPHGSVHVFRSRFLWRGVVYERLRIANFAREQLRLALHLEFGADFADIFEVRGVRRPARGRLLAPIVEPDRVVLSYEGLDGVTRRSALTFSPAPAQLGAAAADFALRLEPAAHTELFITLACERAGIELRASSYEAAFADSQRGLEALGEQSCRITTSNEEFNGWLGRSTSDLFMLVTDSMEGPYPYAGVPWFSTVFGRDGIITALEWLWAYPQLARGVLEYLAATQASEHDPDRDAEPGKILHEQRRGEMAALGEIPFGRYYGTVDATPLFVMLAGAYYERTGDRSFVEALWPHIERALAWIDEHGDRDGDGFVEYARRAGDGLANQGWKDSWDSVFHADGQFAEAPIALCEVQGYVYAARRAAAALAKGLGKEDRAQALARQAAELRERFDRQFWLDDLGTYALALDRDKRPCRVRTSNAGHCLYTGIALPARAVVLAETLLCAEMFSGWGVRTVAVGEARYNPMSYHNGSVWPHDSALVAAGLAAYGFKREAAEIATGLFHASRFVDLHRLPELFCGFVRRGGEGPTLYPVACSPQAWAAGAAFLVVQSLLGLTVDAPNRRVRFRHPALPTHLDLVELRNLRVGAARLDLAIERHPSDVSVRVLSRDDDVEIVVVK